ncbi:sugar nucleotide-binding protein [Lysobacter korlensis]|uniref:dTDP-4-dehydrorhamnose reductase n=1 Tax=Lysobacter korlensis TaxID=553636 RepID=A0ABV6RZS9_9GAMM
MSGDITVAPTSIPGLVVLDIPVHGDNRGWFKENWQREKMTAAGLPDFGPVQNNVSFNTAAGTTRGIHAEPWDKLVSVAAGRIFGAWVDLREGPHFGTVFTAEVDPSRVVFVPRGVGNAYQTLEPDTAYTYLVNHHWSPSAEYTFVNLGDETVAIDWPIPLAQAAVSDKDRAHPRLRDVAPVPPRRILVLGADGQLGRALRLLLPDAEFAGRRALDLSEPRALDGRTWRDYAVVINAAAYTKVDEAETPEGRAEAWASNVRGLARLAAVCREHRITLVHLSSDYVFDGRRAVHGEDEPLTPLGVYGQTKAAGDAVVGSLPCHYIVRTSWVIGDGNNFVRTMAALGDRGIDPAVVSDQVGRLSFTGDIAAAILHLLGTQAPFGTYNVSSGGEPASWADIAKRVFALRGHDPDRVTPVTTTEYFASRAAAPRPLNSVLDLTKIEASGFAVPDWNERLERYLRALP